MRAKYLLEHEFLLSKWKYTLIKESQNHSQTRIALLRKIKPIV